MSREDMQFRDRLLLLAECSNPHKPFNVKRKPILTKQSSKGGPKLSVQDFVRMDPGYTPDIEHLVFPVRKRNPQQVAPAVSTQQQSAASKSRSRLVEMFALSRHLQQRSTDRDTKITRTKPQSVNINRSIDSALASSTKRSSTTASESTTATRRWVSGVDEPVVAVARQNSTAASGSSRLSPATETVTGGPVSAAADNMPSSARGSNVSILHLRSTSEPWEANPPTTYPANVPSRSYFVNRSTGSSVPPLTKHQSLGNPGSQYKWTTSQSFHSGGEVNSPELFIGSSNCSRELSPVRWCDREVDGVYLGRSGWVQVQQRSLDESRRTSYTGILSSTAPVQAAKRATVKLSDYHFNSEPAKNSSERPAYLSLQTRDFEHKTISPPPPPPEAESPPSVTPIISPPPAFQDKKTKSPTKTRTFFGKTPFLPRSNAIEDSDASPPVTPPPLKWSSNAATTPPIRKPKVTVISPATDRPLRTSFNRMPQTKSLEDTTASRRTQFIQHYRGSSSSSSSSMGFRSLDSSFNRPGNIMPRLSENTDSSVDHYQDADEEDNNSSSINISMLPIAPPQIDRNRDKVSPSGRTTRTIHHRNQMRRSPAGSDTAPKHPNCTSPSSSSTSSNEFLSRSPPGPVQQQIRRITPNRPYQSTKSSSQEDPSIQRVRRSRSLQLPEKKPPPYGGRETQTRVSPQHPESHRMVVKMGSTPERPKRHGVHKSKPQMSLEGDMLDEDVLREAEVVTGFLYGNRSKAAAQALLMHRYNNKDDRNREINKTNVNNGVTVYYIGNSKKEKRTLIRGATSPSFSGSKHIFEAKPEIRDICSRENCNIWPHCIHRENMSREPNFVMRSSQSYPLHARSLDSNIEASRKQQEHYKLRLAQESERRKQLNNIPKEKRLSPNRQMTDPGSKKSSPVNPKSRTPTFGTVSGSSSGSDVWLTASGKSNVKSSEASTPLEEMLISVKDSDKVTRPGSAPSEDRTAELMVSQQRSMSLPKSFLSASYQPGTHRFWQHLRTITRGYIEKPLKYKNILTTSTGKKKVLNLVKRGPKQPKRQNVPRPNRCHDRRDHAR